WHRDRRYRFRSRLRVCCLELRDAQKATVEQNPELQKIIQKSDRAKHRVLQTNSPKAIEKFERQKDNVKKTRNCLLYKYREQVREEFDDEQAVIDIERQLSGEALDEEAMETLQEEQMLPVLISLLSKLLTGRHPDRWRRSYGDGTPESKPSGCTVVSLRADRAGVGGQRPPRSRSPPRKHPAVLMAGTIGPMRFLLTGGTMPSVPPRSTRRGLGVVLSVSRTPGHRTTGVSINTHVPRT
ncbi:hypothetical protein ACJ73_06740, partial [Blastomyces percursus]